MRWYFQTLPLGGDLRAALNTRFKILEAALKAGLEVPTAKTAAYTATTGDDVIQADVTSAGFTVTLPAASVQRGHVIRIKKIDSSGNTLTVARAGSDTIDGATSVTTTTQWVGWTFIADGGTQWLIF